MTSGLFSSIQSLSTKLLDAIRGTPSTSQRHDPVESVRKDLDKLSRMLARIQAVQQDAEEREIHDSSVRLWLAELRGVTYQAEDLLDDFHYEVLRCIVESGDAAIEAYHRDGGTKRKFAEMYTSISLASYSFTISEASIPDGMVEKIKGITERFEEIANARRDLHLREDGSRLVTGPQIRPPTSSHVDETAIFGRDEEKEKIISLLNPSNGPDFMILPIVGMGGFGKTMLAQLVYNDSRICRLFNKRCWVYVSEDFDLVWLTKAIVDSMRDSPCESYELSKLQDTLKEMIRGLGLFLVLDDVWNEKRNLWECLRVGFFGAKFVRILTTTRNTSVAKIMQTTSSFQLGSLPEENCWSLFKHFAFGNRETSENANLHEIGRGIVKRCKGSPLAIKALGGILRYEIDEEKWKEILESDISKIDETGEIMPALQLSYQKLPRHLKPCFLYLSMFPKDIRFEKDMVVRLWMAQGFINGNTNNMKTLEEIGSEYFDELQGRSLVDEGPLTKYFLHDLIRDLAISISQEAYQPVLENDQQCNGPCKVYHLYLAEKENLLGSILAPNNYWSIRTFVNECTRSHYSDFVIFSEIACARALHLRYSSLPNTLYTLKHLRYLSIQDSQMEVLPETLCLLYNLQTLDVDSFCLRVLPESIKNLINLRYFQLSSVEIQQLPESIFMLHNLHTLSLRYCINLKELPRGIEQLTRLCILDLPLSPMNMPSGIGKLTTLKPLSGDFSIMDHGMIGGLGELKDMNKLSGLLCISGLRNIDDAKYSSNANLASKPNLHKLILNFQEDSNPSCRDNRAHLHLVVYSSKIARNENVEVIQDVVLQSLQPHGNLTDLTILNYGGRNFPSWLLSPLLPKLTTLNLNFCTEPNFLPPFGQLPYLRFLEISCSLSVRNVGDQLSAYSLLAENDSAKQPNKISYPSLELLSLRNTLNLVEWQTHDGDFPRLEKLFIDNCPKLWKIKTVPREVRVMLIKECGFCEIKFSSESKIRKLLISNCPNLISIHSMGSGLPALVRILVQDCPKLCKLLSFHKLPALKSISLECCPGLCIFPTIPEELKMVKIKKCGFREIMLPSRYEKLIISNCLELISIMWRDMEGCLNFVSEVIFEYCPKLKLLTCPSVIKTLKIHECGFREIIFKSISDYISISNCLQLNLIKWRDGFNPIREVCIEYCPKLKLITIPVGTLKLKIHDCGIREIMFRSVFEKLTISNCVELTSINWRDEGFNSIREVSFEYCPKLELVTIPVGTLKLKIRECGFREIMFRSVSENLSISNCVDLILINWSDGGLATVEEVIFECCPKLKLQFPVKDVLHSMTQRAKIYDCPRLYLGKRYVYQRDTTIEELNLSGNNEIHLSDSKIPLLENHFTLFLTKEDFREVESLTCAPSVGVSCQRVMLNLASLVILKILRCTTVISVAGLDNLRNLKHLIISYCTELCNWNDKTLPLSLEFLKLDSCDKLSSMPLLSVRNHSSTLKDLVIKKCPRLAVLEGFHGLMNLKTMELLHCGNISISHCTESLQFRPRITIGDCPLMRDWCQTNNITYNEFYPPIGNPQDDREAEQESAEST